MNTKMLSTKLTPQAMAVRPREGSDRAVASAYNQAGNQYLVYADGDPNQLYAFDGQYAYGDRCIWQLLDAKLCALRASGAESVRILDLGCGPGTWLRRMVTRARTLGFRNIVARGIDIAGWQVQRARELAANLSSLPGVSLSFEIGDIFEPLPEPDASVDLCVCLYAVLNHLQEAKLPSALAEISRVTAGHFITTVRAIGSTPTVCVDAIERARRYRRDNRSNRLDVEFQNGRRVSLYFHLFSAAEVQSLVSPHLDIEDLCGLDLFHGRFASDSRWNPQDFQDNNQFSSTLEALEKTYCRDADFIDRATHLLLVGKRQTAFGTRRTDATLRHVA